jgi:hypothetical protein
VFVGFGVGRCWPHRTLGCLPVAAFDDANVVEADLLQRGFDIEVAHMGRDGWVAAVSCPTR